MFKNKKPDIFRNVFKEFLQFLHQRFGNLGEDDQIIGGLRAESVKEGQGTN